MKARSLTFFAASILIALAVWSVRAPNAVHADKIPEKYQDTVRKAREYLAKNQHDDGHWEGDDGQHPVAMTGLVGLALLMERESPGTRYRLTQPGKVESPPATTHAASVRKAADWLMKQSAAQRDGLIFSGHASETTRYMEGHGLATIFLAGVLADELDDDRATKLRQVLTGAVKCIVKARSSRGGWHHTSKVEGHDFDAIAPTVIQVQALQAAKYAGIAVPEEVLTDAQAYLVVVLEKELKTGARRTTEIAGGLACRYCSQDRGIDRECNDWIRHCQVAIATGIATKFGRDELTHYYYSQAVISGAGESTMNGPVFAGECWKAYREAMFDQLQKTQQKDGSWPAGNGLSSGPLYTTAVWCTVLQLDHRSHPAMRSNQERLLLL